jgi:hypothetical protein
MGTDDDPAGSYYYTAYEHHSSVLRTWLVAYGVGAPVLVLTNENVWSLLRHSGESRFIAACFLLGVILQVVIAALNKVLMWSSYYAEEHADYADTVRYRLTAALRGQFWIDFLADMFAILLFATATYRMFVILAA